jgi:hypothetical protein
MKLTHANFVSKALLLGLIIAATTTLTAETQAGVNDPLQVIYLFSGVKDNGGGAGVGVATSVHCTNFSGATENLQFVVRDNSATVKADVTVTIGQAQTRTASTHGTSLYAEQLLQTGSVGQGALGILSTSVNIACTAQILDASTAVPNGISLHGIRFNPIPGTQE